MWNSKLYQLQFEVTQKKREIELFNWVNWITNNVKLRRSVLFVEIEFIKRLNFRK